METLERPVDEQVEETRTVAMASKCPDGKSWCLDEAHCSNYPCLQRS